MPQSPRSPISRAAASTGGTARLVYPGGHLVVGPDEAVEISAGAADGGVIVPKPIVPTVQVVQRPDRIVERVSEDVLDGLARDEPLAVELDAAEVTVEQLRPLREQATSKGRRLIVVLRGDADGS